MDAAVQVIAFDEPESKLHAIFESIENQETGHLIHPEAWITPSHPDDPSFRVVEQHGFPAFEAGQGKLTARNEAHNSAFDRGFDAVVTLDVDATLLSKYTLDNLLTPLETEGVGATNSMPISGRRPDGTISPGGLLIDLGGRIEDVVYPHMHGQCSAFTERAWAYAGPFSTHLDQTDVDEVRLEEEVGFYNRINEKFEMEFCKDAPVYNDMRRHLTRLGVTHDESYQERIGTKTFGDEY